MIFCLLSRDKEREKIVRRIVMIVGGVASPFFRPDVVTAGFSK